MKHEEIKDAVIQAESLVHGSDAVATLAAAILQADATLKLAAVFDKINADKVERRRIADEQVKKWLAPDEN